MHYACHAINCNLNYRDDRLNRLISAKFSPTQFLESVDNGVPRYSRHIPLKVFTGINCLS